MTPKERDIEIAKLLGYKYETVFNEETQRDGGGIKKPDGSWWVAPWYSSEDKAWNGVRSSFAYIPRAFELVDYLRENEWHFVLRTPTDGGWLASFGDAEEFEGEGDTPGEAIAIAAHAVLSYCRNIRKTDPLCAPLIGDALSEEEAVDAEWDDTPIFEPEEPDVIRRNIDPEMTARPNENAGRLLRELLSYYRKWTGD